MIDRLQTVPVFPPDLEDFGQMFAEACLHELDKSPIEQLYSLQGDVHRVGREALLVLQHVMEVELATLR